MNDSKDNKDNVKDNENVNKRKFLKNQRKEQYSRINQANQTVLGTSEIRIEDFLQARKNELSNFVNILKTKNINKSGNQLIPRHLRRRAMSHNPYRIPIKFRNTNFNSKNSTNCKKHKFKKRQVVNTFNKRRLKQNWMETHMYHSKRFFMKTMFNRKIAFKRTDKSEKCCYKFSKYSTVMYDKSYYKTIFIDFVNIKNMLIFRPFIRKIFQNDNDDINGEHLIYSFNGRLIGTIEIINMNINTSNSKKMNIIKNSSTDDNLIDVNMDYKSNEDENQNLRFIFNFHPLIFEEIKCLLIDIYNNNNEFKVKISFNLQINNFEIHGKLDPILKLFKLLHYKNLITDDVKKDSKNLINENNKESNDDNITFLDLKNVNFIYLNTPESNFKLNERVLKKAVMLTKNVNNDENELGMMKESNLNFEIDENEIFNYFLKNSKDKIEYTLKDVIDRTPLNRRNKIKCNKINEKTIALKKGIEKEKNKIENKILVQDKSTSKGLKIISNPVDNKSKTIRKSSSHSKAKKTENVEVFPFELFNIKGNSEKDDNLKNTENKTFFIITKHKLLKTKKKNNECNSNIKSEIYSYYFRIYHIPIISSNLLRIISYLNVKIIGYSEYKTIFNSSDSLFFPQDFPSTKSSEQYTLQMINEKLQKYIKLPSSKRINYQKLKFPSPFFTNWRLTYFYLKDKGINQILSDLKNSNNSDNIQKVDLNLLENFNYYNMDNMLISNLFKDYTLKKHLLTNEERKEDINIEIKIDKELEEKEEKDKKTLNCNDFLNVNNLKKLDLFDSNIVMVENLFNKELTIFNIKNYLKFNKSYPPLVLIPIMFECEEKGVPKENASIHIVNQDILFDYLKYKQLKNKEKNSKNLFSLIDCKDKDHFNKLEEENKFVKSYLQRKRESLFEVEFQTLVKNKTFYNEIKDLLGNSIANDVNENRNKYNIINKDLSFQTTRNKYPIVGFTTTGFYCYENSKGSGKGFIVKEAVKECLKTIENKKYQYILFKNPGCKQYHFAKFSIIKI